MCFTLCKTPNVVTPNIKTRDNNFFRNAKVLCWQQEIFRVPPQNEIPHCRLSLCRLYIDGLERSHFALCRSGSRRQTVVNNSSCVLWQDMNGSAFTIVCFQAINDLAVANMAQKHGEPNEVNFIIMQIFPPGLSNKMWVEYALKTKQVQRLFVINQIHNTSVWRITDSIITKQFAWINFTPNTQFPSKYSFPSIFCNTVFQIFTTKIFFFSIFNEKF